MKEFFSHFFCGCLRWTSQNTRRTQDKILWRTKWLLLLHYMVQLNYMLIYCRFVFCAAFFCCCWPKTIVLEWWMNLLFAIWNLLHKIALYDIFEVYYSFNLHVAIGMWLCVCTYTHMCASVSYITRKQWKWDTATIDLEEEIADRKIVDWRGVSAQTLDFSAIKHTRTSTHTIMSIIDAKQNALIHLFVFV